MLDKAGKTSPTTDETGLFSEKFIQAMALFDAAVAGVSRVFLDTLIPAIESLASLLPQWLVPTGSPEAKGIEDKFNQDLEKHFGTSAGFWQWLHGEEEHRKSTFGPAKVGIASSSGSTSKSGNAFADGETINGIQVYSDMVGGARGAATISNTSQSSRRSSSVKNDTRIGDVHITLPNATNAKEVAGGLKGWMSNYLGGDSINSAY